MHDSSIRSRLNPMLILHGTLKVDVTTSFFHGDHTKIVVRSDRLRWLGKRIAVAHNSNKPIVHIDAFCF
jgi:hypothetical protein